VKIYATTQSDTEFLQSIKGKDLWVFCSVSDGVYGYETYGYLQVVDIYPTTYYIQDDYGRMQPKNDWICDCHFFRCEDGDARMPTTLYSMKNRLNYTQSYYVNNISVVRPVEAMITEDLIMMYDEGIDQ